MVNWKECMNIGEAYNITTPDSNSITTITDSYPYPAFYPLSNAISTVSSQLSSDSCCAAEASNATNKLTKGTKKPKRIPEINDIRVYADKRTVVVYFKDGTKTVAVCDENDTFDVVNGVAVCVLKKTCGNNVLGQIQKVVKRISNNEKLAEDKKKADIEEQKRIERKKQKNARKKLVRKAKREIEYEKIKRELLNGKTLNE